MTALHPRYLYPLVTPWTRPSVGQRGRAVAAPTHGNRRRRRFTLIGLGLLCIGALPCIGHGPVRRQPECESHLKSLFTGVRTSRPDWHQKEGIQPSLMAFGFSPERGNRYAYFLGPGPMEDRSGVEAVQVPGQMGVGVDTFKFHGHRALTLSELPPEIAWQVGLQVTGGRYEFIAACAGDADDNVNDSPDVWTISSMDRVINGEPVGPGEPYQHMNDKTTN